MIVYMYMAMDFLLLAGLLGWVYHSLSSKYNYILLWRKLCIKSNGISLGLWAAGGGVRTAYNYYTHAHR